MARQILHLFRKRKLSGGALSWLPIRIMSLNEWLRRVWMDLLPEYIQASEYRRLIIWIEAMRRVPPPESFLEGIAVAADLDDNYATMVRHLINPCNRDVSQPLARWSFEVSRIFVDLMRSKGFIHPSEIPIYLSDVLSLEDITETSMKQRFEKGIENKQWGSSDEEGYPCFRLNERKYGFSGKIKHQHIDIPERIILAGLYHSSPLERRLFSCLQKITDVIFMDLHPQDRQDLTAISLPDDAQEAEWVIEKAIESSKTVHLDRIGIVVPDIKSYGGLFEWFLEDIVGERAGESWSGFNITMGRPVIKSSLVQAAILPIRLAMEGQTRTLALALLQSSYYRIWAQWRNKLAMLDKEWRKANIDGRFDRLISCIEGKYPDEARLLKDLVSTLSPLILDESRFKVLELNRIILDIWMRLGFPAIASEEDQISWGHLMEGIGELERELGEEYIQISEYHKWLLYFLENKLFSERGHENAGIQIMGLVEARGLSFDRLFITGMVSGGVPQPTRYLPFLSQEERQKIQGGTADDQYRFAKVLFRDLCAAAPCLTLTRPEQRDGDPLVPSPFWPDCEEKACMDLWFTGNPVWARSAWLSQTRKGIKQGDDISCRKMLSEDDKRCLASIPDSISVTELDDGIACPFRFFARHCLGLDRMECPESGILPRIRGEMLHKLLASFIAKALRMGLDLVKDWNEVRRLLESEAMRMISAVSPSFPYHVELRRWLDNNDGIGLLDRWLEEERQNWEKGFRWLAVESSFSGLMIGGHNIRIRGRIDRIDHHPCEGYICWDYKTGRIPSKRDIEELKSTQILSYLTAVKRGLIKIDANPDAFITGGFIQLDSASSIKISEISMECEGWKKVLSEWECRASDLFDRLEEGDVRPFPKPAPMRKDEGACEGCPVRVLCGYKLT
ncbi:PD-(D/E)XK nuclease family protein [bacterium]|nr:PD-(D/E)XK nuclease family protein [bacterium]